YRNYYVDRFGSEPKSAGHVFSLARQHFEKGNTISLDALLASDPDISGQVPVMPRGESDIAPTMASDPNPKPTEVRPRTLQMRLDAVAQGMQETLFRTAVSPVV